MNTTNNEKTQMECPICGCLHPLEMRKRLVTAVIKNQKVHYHELYYVCENSDDEENEFIPSNVMDANLMAARDAYRTLRNLLTSEAIVSLRNEYGLTQKELSNMLGWGGATIARYESKFIQDETHDEILRTIRDDALAAKEYLEKNKGNFDDRRYHEISSAIEDKIKKTSQNYLTHKALIAKYTEYSEMNDYTGGTVLNIDKICDMAAFFAQNCNESLYKVKLMKLLWYSDAVSFRDYGHSMSGLVYQHMQMGALPVGHYELMSLIPHEEVYEDYEFTMYKILPRKGFQESVFSNDELSILNRVQTIFKDFTGKMLADYMHKEKAYIQTASCALIPFSLAKFVSL